MKLRDNQALCDEVRKSIEDLPVGDAVVDILNLVDRHLASSREPVDVDCEMCVQTMLPATRGILVAQAESFVFGIARRARGTGRTPPSGTAPGAKP